MGMAASLTGGVTQRALWWFFAPLARKSQTIETRFHKFPLNDSNSLGLKFQTDEIALIPSLARARVEFSCKKFIQFGGNCVGRVMYSNWFMIASPPPFFGARFLALAEGEGEAFCKKKLHNPNSPFFSLVLFFFFNDTCFRNFPAFLKCVPV